MSRPELSNVDLVVPAGSCVICIAMKEYRNIYDADMPDDQKSKLGMSVPLDVRMESCEEHRKHCLYWEARQYNIQRMWSNGSYVSSMY